LDCSEEILKIEAIDENTAKELKERAEEYLKKEKEDNRKKIKRAWCRRCSYKF